MLVLKLFVFWAVNLLKKQMYLRNVRDRNGINSNKLNFLNNKRWINCVLLIFWFFLNYFQEWEQYKYAVWKQVPDWITEKIRQRILLKPGDQICVISSLHFQFNSIQCMYNWHKICSKTIFFAKIYFNVLFIIW